MRRRLLILLAAAAIGAVFAAGLFLHGAEGGSLLLLTDIVLIGMARVTWPHLRPQGRPLRIAVIVVIAVIGVVKLVHG